MVKELLVGGFQRFFIFPPIFGMVPSVFQRVAATNQIMVNDQEYRIEVARTTPKGVIVEFPLALTAQKLYGWNMFRRDS